MNKNNEKYFRPQQDQQEKEKLMDAIDWHCEDIFGLGGKPIEFPPRRGHKLDKLIK